MEKFPLDLHTNVQYIKGVGPHLAGVLAKKGIYNVGDLLFHFPSRYVDRRNILPIAKTPPGKDRTIIADVITSGVTYLGKRRSRIFEVIATDGKGMISAKWFNFHEEYMKKKFKKDKKILLAGELTEYNGTKQFVHPEAEVLEEENEPQFGGRLISIYPLTEGISQNTVRKIIRNAIEKYSSEIKEVFPREFLSKYKIDGLKDAMLTLHSPPNEADVEMFNSRRSSAHRTIIFLEFFMFELGLALRKAATEKKKGISIKFNKKFHDEFLSTLPFELTGAQERVISEIIADMERPHPMNRLVQGDVGSGKTLVALACALQTLHNGNQAAFMAPTEILAEQHYRTVSKITDKFRMPCALLTASIKGEMRESILAGIKDGSLPLLIGTHALIQSGVEFKKLGLAIIDEQHRFGVMQRKALHKKGAEPDVLVMTATPIPRTLSMTLYGDLEVSVIDEMPKGRKTIITKVYTDKLRQKLYDGMRKELSLGHQAYVVYPLIEESEKVDLKNATMMAEELSKVFAPDYRVELLHGKMKAEEKEKTMNAFKDGKVHILAATSVVEVGVDVPNATVMIVEHAERFGLAQLHQLRGRVGRGDDQSFCIMVCSERLTEEASRRLNIMKETCDGFRIAEEDLAIRGPGEYLGTRQSGLPLFKLADISLDIKLLQLARQAAFEVVTEDPLLETTKNRPIYEAIRDGGALELGGVG